MKEIEKVIKTSNKRIDRENQELSFCMSESDAKILQSQKVSINRVINILDDIFPENKFIFRDARIITIYENALARNLASGGRDFEKACDFAHDSNIPINFKSPDIIFACQKGIENNIKNDLFKAAENLNDLANENEIPIDLQQSKIAIDCQNKLEKSFSEGDTNNILNIIIFTQAHNIRLDYKKNNLYKDKKLAEIVKRQIIVNIILDEKEVANLFFTFAQDNQLSISLEKIVDESVRENNWELASRMIVFCEENGVDCSEKLKNEIQIESSKEFVEREKKDSRREDYGEINLSEELFDFYSNQYILSNIQQKEWEINNYESGRGGELKISDRVYLGDAKNNIAKNIEKNAEWIRMYLVRALMTELRLEPAQEGLVDSINPMTTIKGRDNFVTKATESEIRTFLLATEACFKDKKWTKKTGGELWGKIAEIVYEFWKDDLSINDKTILIDRAFQQEHNSGIIFDKDNKIIHDKKKDKKILDVKFQAKNLEELLEKLRDLFLDNIEKFDDNARELLLTSNKIKDMKIFKKGFAY